MLQQLPIPSRTEWPLTSTKPYGSPDGAWGFATQQGFNDVSGNGHHMTNYGMGLTKKGGMVGYNDAKYTEASGLTHVANTPFSVNLWYNLRDTTGSLIFNWGGTTTGISLYAFNGSQMYFYGMVATGTPTIIFSYSANEWQMVTVTYDGDKVYAYRDGELLYTSAAGKSLNGVSSATYLRIGTGTVSAASPYGEFRGLEVWGSRCLTQDDITAIYEEGYPSDSPVAAYGYYTGINFEDVSGNGLALTNVGSIVRAKGDFLLNGSSAYAYRTVSNFRSTDTQGAISLWLKKSVAQTGTIFASADEATTNQYHWYFYTASANTLNLSVKEASANVSVLSGAKVLDLNRWHHVVIMSVGGVTKWYVDNVEDTISVVAGTNCGAWFDDVTNRDSFSIGAFRRTTTTVFFPGNIAGVTYYPTPLSDSERADIYNAGVPLNRANELFSTIDGKDDRSTYGATITRVAPAISVDGAMRFKGTSGNFNVADKIGTGDVTIYFNTYIVSGGGLNLGRIIDNSKLQIYTNAGGVISVSSDTGVTSISVAHGLLIPARVAITRRSNGLAAIYINGSLAVAEANSGVPAVATTMYIGDRSAGGRTFNGEISLVRINSGIDTLEQIQQDNRDYGF